jgi:alpha-L-rhamnosidase
MNFKKKVYVILFSLFNVVNVFAASPIKIDQLFCEYLQNPLGIDIPAPRFGWLMSSSQRNQSQSAYEIIVSDNLNAIQQSNGNIWSTGKIASNNSTLVDYGGPALKSFTRYYWRVRVYDQNGEVSTWSAVNSFETAMMNSADWKGKWIGDGIEQPAKEEDRYKDDPMPLFKKVFATSKKISSARLYISGVGYYEAYLNGKRLVIMFSIRVGPRIKKKCCIQCMILPR